MSLAAAREGFAWGAAFTDYAEVLWGEPGQLGELGGKRHRKCLRCLRFYFLGLCVLFAFMIEFW